LAFLIHFGKKARSLYSYVLVNANTKILWTAGILLKGWELFVAGASVTQRVVIWCLTAFLSWTGVGWLFAFGLGLRSDSENLNL